MCPCEFAFCAGALIDGDRMFPIESVNNLFGATIFFGSPRQLTIAGTPALALVYATQSAPNPVTGKRVTLVVDRYYLAHRGKLAVVDLGTPEGVDNVDAYRLMIESFRWR